MSKLLKSKVGYFISGIYLLVTLPVIVAMAFIFVLRYYNGNADVHPIEEQINIGALVVTLPWSIVVTIAGLAFPMHTGRFVIVVGLVVAALINASIFYLIGYLFSMAFTYIRGSENQSPSGTRIV